VREMRGGAEDCGDVSCGMGPGMSGETCRT
jgi:hypothetical protein